MTQTSTAPPDTASVRLEVADDVATIVLDRPGKKNALDPEAWDQLLDVLRRVEGLGARAVVLTGAGGDFCAGADVSAARTDHHPLRRMRRVTDALVALHELPLPVVAKVDGVAVGAGWSLALCADLLVATPRSRFSQIFARRGLSLDCGASWLLPRAVGLQHAKRLAFLAEILGAEEAHALGMVTWLQPEDEIDAFVDDLARRLATGPTVALAQDKSLLDLAHDRSFREAVEAENAAQAINFATDAPEARAAIAEGRPPRFTGRWAR